MGIEVYNSGQYHVDVLNVNGAYYVVGYERICAYIDALLLVFGFTLDIMKLHTKLHEHKEAAGKLSVTIPATLTINVTRNSQ